MRNLEVNMRKKPGLAFVAGGLFIIAAAILLTVKLINGGGSNGEMEPAKPFRGGLSMKVSTVGTVNPQNRLEIKPPINGRVERILVNEGQDVKVGDVLLYMSSTERATLIDAARMKGDQEFKYWQTAYKETPLVAPINGTVIVRDVEPGQTVTTNDALLVLSDRLIVQADVDETDIGEVKLGQKAVVRLDAYPEIKIEGVVDHISYESKVVNNVTIYKVDILPNSIPNVFRSGMSTSLEIIVKDTDDALLIPTDALISEDQKTFVWAKNEQGKIAKKAVEVGLESDGNTEVISGLSEDDTIYIPVKMFSVPKKKNGTNPFMPSRVRGTGR